MGRRFLWESHRFKDSRAPEVELEFGERLIEYEVPPNIETIGLECERNPENQRLVVQGITDGSWAAKLGIRILDEVLQANGSSLDVMGDDDVMQALQARPLVLLLKVSDLDVRDSPYLQGTWTSISSQRVP